MVYNVSDWLKLIERKEKTMIYHQIRMAIRPDAPKAALDHALELLRRLGRELDVVQSWCVGRDFGGEFEYGALYVLPDVDAYRTYMYSPLHRHIDEVGLPLVRNMVSFDLTDDPDADTVGAGIAEVHRSRFAGDPALVDLIDDLGSYQGSAAPATDITTV
jgi:hypothetical protein